MSGGNVSRLLGGLVLMAGPFWEKYTNIAWAVSMFGVFLGAILVVVSLTMFWRGIRMYRADHVKSVNCTDLDEILKHPE